MENRADLKQLDIVLVSRFPRDIDAPRGGVESATVSLARALVKFGVGKISVVTAEFGIDVPQIEVHESIHVHRLRRSNWPMMLDVFNGPTAGRLQRYVESLKPDVVHFHETWGFAANRYQIPTVFTLHGFDSLNLPQEKSRFWWLRSKVWLIAEYFGFRNQKQIISIAPYVEESIRSKVEVPITSIWNALGIGYFERGRKELDSRILFLGWLNARKNPIALVEAFALIHEKFPETKLVLCGEAADPEYFALLKQVIANHGLENKVELPGRINQDKVAEQLMGACMLVLPSFQENAPMVIAEAMAMGVPVVASNNCGIPDMLDYGEAGILIDPTNRSELASAIGSLLENPEARTELGARAKQSAQNKFHPDAVARKTVALYHRILNGQ